MPLRNIERELENLAALRNSQPGEARTKALRKALNDKVNVMVAKAAAVTDDLQLEMLIPDLCAAFDRLLIDPAKTDPKCWAKEAIVKALKRLGHADSGVFVKGVHHVQLEPVWGGEEDAAANLRATCALALLDCTDITREDKLWLIMPLLTERSASLPKDAALALQSLEGRESALLLRIKARMGDRDPTVTGQVLESLLRVEGDAAIPFVVEFLRSTDRETREEAALALGVSRLTGAVRALTDAFDQQRLLLDSELLCRALSISRHEEAFQFLLDVIRTHRLNDARAALNSLNVYRDSAELREKVAVAVGKRTEPEIQRDFARVFG